MIVAAVVTVLCGVGLYASLFMLRKARQAERGSLAEPSVVQSPRARLFGGLSNALVGAVYYTALAVVVWLPLTRPEALTLLAIVAFAAGTSVLLAYSLLFVTRRACAYCWTSHTVNWSLVFLVGLHVELR